MSLMFEMEPDSTSQQGNIFSFAGKAGHLLWDAVFAAACNDHTYCRVGKFDHPLSEHGRRKIRLWQAACTLVSFVPEEETRNVIFQIFDMLVVSPRFYIGD